jgi:hypothetical protein
MSGGAWTDDPAVLARIERLNDAYAHGDIDIDELERRTAEVIARAERAAPPPSARDPQRRARADARGSSGRSRWILPCSVAAGIITVIAAIASATNTNTVPDVVGMYPQEAIAAVNAAGLTTNSHGGVGDEEGQGFVVCETVPAAGAKLDPDTAKVEIFSRRDCQARSALAKAYAKQWRTNQSHR